MLTKIFSEVQERAPDLGSGFESDQFIYAEIELFGVYVDLSNLLKLSQLTFDNTFFDYVLLVVW